MEIYSLKVNFQKNKNKKNYYENLGHFNFKLFQDYFFTFVLWCFYVFKQLLLPNQQQLKNAMGKLCI